MSPTIRLDSSIKKELEELMLNELKENLNNPKILIEAIRNKYGYTYNEFIAKLIIFYNKHRRKT